MTELYIGLMSGTSLDGVDAVLVDFSGAHLQVSGHCSAPFPDSLKAELLALNAPGSNELHRAALAANALARIFASQVQTLLAQCQKSPTDIRAIGAHGQTVRHRPQEFDGTGYTLQLNQPALLAELCGIDVVADFRSRDVAAGGQGAPLVPPFHQAVFAKPGQGRAVLNIGGISNVTLLADSQHTLRGFDCGPGNGLMDAWCQRHTGQAFDQAGEWAATGKVNPLLLEICQSEPYFSRVPPKSTGRDLFNDAWLQSRLNQVGDLPAADVQNTLTELTAWACAQSVRSVFPACEALIVCGGGVFNTYLMQRLQSLLSPCTVLSSAAEGLPPQQVEAAAFAWLAMQTVNRKTANSPMVTGASGCRVLGALYPA